MDHLKTGITLSLKAPVALSRMEIQMRRDASKQVTSHTNKWLGKQRKAGEEVRKDNRTEWKSSSHIYTHIQTRDK